MPRPLICQSHSACLSPQQGCPGTAAPQELTQQAGVLVVFILVDRPQASVLDMRSVAFHQGRPQFSAYLDSFPFPLYIVLRDTAALPTTLADLLRQWIHLTASG